METDRAVVSSVSVVRTEPPVTVPAVTDKRDDVNGHAMSRAPDSTPGPLDGSQWPVLPAVSTPSTVVRRSPKEKQSVQPDAVQTTTRNRSTSVTVTGSGQGSGLRSVKRKRLASVFATRFEPQVTCDDILVYLNSRLSVKLPVKVSLLETKHDSYASFHITCEPVCLHGPVPLAGRHFRALVAFTEITCSVLG